MALSVTLTGSGTIGQIEPGWSVTENATPVAPGDTSGGTGNISFSAGQGEDSEFVIGNGLTVTDSSLGTITGGDITSAISNGLSEVTDTTIPLTGTSGLAILNGSRTFGPVWEGMNIELPPLGVTGDGDNQISQVNAIAIDEVHGFVYLGGTIWRSNGSQDYGRILQYRTDGSYVGMMLESYIVSNSTGTIGALAIDATTGTLLVGINSGVTQVLRVDTSGNITATYGAFGGGDGQFNNISGIAVDASGNIYTTDPVLTRVTKFNSSGVYQAKVSTGALNPPRAISVSNSIVWVACTSATTAGEVFRYNTSLALQDDYIHANVPPNPQISAVTATTAWRTTDDKTYELVDNTGTVLDTVDLSPIPYNAKYNISDADYGYAATLASFGVVAAWWQGLSRNSRTSLGETVGPTPRAYALPLTVVNSLEQAVRYYLDQYDASMSLTWNASINPLVALPGISTEGWTVLKQLAAAYGIEFAWVNDGLVVRDLGETVLSLDNAIEGSASLSLNAQATGLSVDFKNYNTTTGLNVTLYDAFVEGNVIQVSPGETTTFTVQTNSYPTAISQPIVTDVTPTPAGTYRVSGSDSLPIVAAQWTAFGGSVHVEANATTPGALDITVTAPSAIPGIPTPYSFAVSDGSTSYAQFSVTGSGVVTNPETVNILSGADPARTAQTVAFSVDNIAHSSRAMIYDRCTWALTQASGPNLTLTVDVPSRDTAGFGLTNGSLISFKESQYRVTEADMGNEQTSITAARHVTVGEFDALMASDNVTVGLFDAYWDGNDCEDLKIKSLRRTV